MMGGGDILVKGAVSLAQRLGVSTLVIGLTIVAFGTSAPELVVGVDAVLEGAPTLALGNAVGSNIANILLVVGLPAMIMPVAVNAPKLGRNQIYMLGASMLLILMAFNGPITAAYGAVLVVLLLTFLFISSRKGSTPSDEQSLEDEAVHMIEDHGIEAEAEPQAVWISIAQTVAGLAALVFGADLLVDGAVTVARSLGVSEAIIGLSLVALGTSLPELVTAFAAAVRGHSDVAIGNVVGSNIFNILGIVGVSSLVGDIPVPDSFLNMDLWVMIGASALLLPAYFAKIKIGRLYGGFLLALYIGYMVQLTMTSGL